MPLNEQINAGEVLLQVICFYYNRERNFDKIEDPLNITSDDKGLLLKFITSHTHKNLEFSLRSLNRFIKEVKSRKYINRIPSGNPTLCTLCYIALKSKNPGIPFLQRDKKDNGNIEHGQSFYATDFTRIFVEPKIALGRMPADFCDSCWYLYINGRPKGTEIRKTNRKILRMTMINNQLKAEYFTTNNVVPDWSGYGVFNSMERKLSLLLKTSINVHREMNITFDTNFTILPPLVEGQMCFTSMHDEDTIIKTTIYVVKNTGTEMPTLAEFADGIEKSIHLIESKLRDVKCQIITTTKTPICHG